MIDIPKNRSLIVYANYRTGSTALCELLSKQTGYVNYDELFHPMIPRLTQTITSPCVIKIMPDHRVSDDCVDLVDSGFKIGIRRKSIVKQIASFYICSKTHKWHYFAKESPKEYTVDIVTDDLENEVRYILDMQVKYEKIPKDIELIYEDIGIMNNIKFVEVTKPTNYDEIIKETQAILDTLNYAQNQ